MTKPLDETFRRVGPRPGQTPIRRIGLAKHPFHDLYHHALMLSWRGFFALGACIYLAANAVFALLYLAQRGAVLGAHPGSFGDAFFFSVQTMGTIGYGVMAPATVYANLIMTAETLFGMILFAVTTGLVFARFSRPTARVLFSRVAVITPVNGVPTLMMRVANERGNQILQAEVGVTVLRDETTREGERMRRFHDLSLSRQRTPIFALTFSIMHPIDASSPLAGVTPESLAATRTEIVVTVTGLDETMSQPVHARWSYLADEVLFGRRFVDILSDFQSGTIDFTHFHETIPDGPARKDRQTA